LRTFAGENPKSRNAPGADLRFGTEGRLSRRLAVVHHLGNAIDSRLKTGASIELKAHIEEAQTDRRFADLTQELT
jgi:hypothetical protein